MHGIENVDDADPNYPLDVGVRRETTKGYLTR